MAVAVGVDIGGTNLKAVLVSDGREILARSTKPIGGKADPELLLAEIADLVEEVRGGSDPIGVGFGLAGTVFPGATLRTDMTNLPNLAGVALQPRLEGDLRRPCRFDNDARVALRGEMRMGAARGVRNAVCLTLGTGIGSGLLVDGRIHGGAHGSAGEIGLWRIGASREARDSLEGIAAPASLEQRAGFGYAALADRRGAADQAGHVGAALALLGQAIANLHLLLDLEAVILSGGITAIGRPLLDAVDAAFRQACPSEFHFDLDIRLGALGAWAGAVGAAWLLLDEAAE